MSTHNSTPEWQETMTSAREYLLGTLIELERRRVAQENPENLGVGSLLHALSVTAGALANRTADRHGSIRQGEQSFTCWSICQTAS